MYSLNSLKYFKNIEELQREIDQNTFNSSNLDFLINKGLNIAENISKHWASSDFENKQMLQKLVFLEGITYSKENDAVRTPCVNALFAAIPILVKVSDKNKKGNNHNGNRNDPITK